MARTASALHILVKDKELAEEIIANGVFQGSCHHQAKLSGL